MKQLYRELTLPNGLTVKFFNHTRHYFGNFHLVKLQISCTIPLTEDLFDSRDAYNEAARLLGEGTSYHRTVEQMGVPAEEIELQLDKLARNFTQHTLDYLSRPDFSARFVQSQLNRIKQKAARTAISTPYSHE